MCHKGDSSIDGDYQHVYSNIFSITTPCSSESPENLLNDVMVRDNYRCDYLSNNYCRCPRGHIAYYGYNTVDNEGYNMLDRSLGYVEKAMDSSDSFQCNRNAFYEIVPDGGGRSNRNCYCSNNNFAFDNLEEC